MNANQPYSETINEGAGGRGRGGGGGAGVAALGGRVGVVECSLYYCVSLSLVFCSRYSGVRQLNEAFMMREIRIQIMDTCYEEGVG